MTREELHQKVWSQPIKTLAKSMGISDVALAKRCRTADIPVPPRGWWARKGAGKAVKIAPLPKPRPTFANYFPARKLDIATEPKEGEPAAPPRFRDLAAVKDEIRAMVKTVKVPSTLESPHPIVARLLKKDAERKPSASPSHFLPDRNGPKFATPSRGVSGGGVARLSPLFSEDERRTVSVFLENLSSEGFSVEPSGELVSRSGRSVAPPGFLSALLGLVRRAVHSAYGTSPSL